MAHVSHLDREFHPPIQPIGVSERADVRRRRLPKWEIGLFGVALLIAVADVLVLLVAPIFVTAAKELIFIGVLMVAMLAMGIIVKHAAMIRDGSP